MKAVFRTFIIAMIFLIFVITLLFSIKNGYLDKPIKIGLEYYLNKKNVKANFGDLHVKGKNIILKQVEFQLSDQLTAYLDKLDIKLNLDEIFKNKNLVLNADTDNLIIKNVKNNNSYKTNLSTNYSIGIISGSTNGKFTLTEIDHKHYPLTAICNYRSGIFTEKILNCDFKLGDNSNLSFNSKTESNNIKLKANLANIPISAYKIIEKFLPSNGVFDFLNESILSGNIVRGELNLNANLSNEQVLTNDNLSGKFYIDDLEYKFDRDFPSLKKVEMEVYLSGTSSKFFIKKAYLTNTLISNGIITFDWTGVDTSRVIAHAEAIGPAVDLTGFIPRASLEKTRKIGIDLEKFTGTANTKIELEIPISPNIKNYFNIVSELTNVGIKIFGDDLELKSGKISGGFDGDKVFLEGKGKINNFNSDMIFTYNLIDKTEYEQLLRIKTAVKAQNQNVGLMKVLSGSSFLNFEYKVKDEKCNLKADANLKNVEFYIDKIAIHKLLGEDANLSLSGHLDNFPNSDIEFKLIGDNKLKIIGNLLFKNGKYKLALPFIDHKDTSINADITFDENDFDADVRGSKLDLSNADLMHFLKKNKENTNTNLKVKIEKIKLKNNVYLDNVLLTIKCNKTKCFKGYLDSKVGTKFFKMLLKTFEDKEEWVITSTNAGALFRALGLYTDMKTGVMLVILNTKRKEVKKGEIIPILDGSFTFRNFVIVDTPFLTRLVSVVSLPGIKNLFTNNKDIIFKTMNGKFTYKNDIIKISESSAEGPFFDFTLTGRIDTINRKIDINGGVIPSLYGLSTLLKYIPILGKAFSGGHRKGIIFAPYSLHQSY